MKALLLAAGRGKRLAPFTDAHPKCLLSLGGRTLLERHLDAFATLGIREVIVVVGHLKEQIEAAVAQAPAPLTVRLLTNPRFTLGSLLSLWAAREQIAGDLLVMDADVLYPRELLRRLLTSSSPSCLLLDESSPDSGEEMKLGVRGSRVVAIGRRFTERYERVGEGVGFLKVSADHSPILRAVVERMVQEGREDAEYEEAVHEFLQKCVVGFQAVSDLPWTEIDFPEDVKKAEKLLPRIDATTSY